ncbi:hypothetical protein [Pontibacter mangrovi]|uniref:HNH endonuclease n=1 Tax=Pontibacter mangrovi TaxID=2589816 RepID=A0A501W5D3_9BACT|nr:hypothetical protein [Pontibacter mangrovi]TPE42461.1 hypothetical protein FJM65_17800 [Pontibacter mangrovi]
MTQEEFLIQHLIEDKSYPLLLQENRELSLSILQAWWATGTEFRTKIRRANTLYTSRKGNPAFAAFERAGKRAFFEWYQRQPRICACCNIEEYKLEELFDTGALETKRGRGRSLELERRDTRLNLYTEDNCVLACYFCNNHKGDTISEKDHLHYFSVPTRQYLEDKYSQFKGKRRRIKVTTDH